MTLRPGDVLAGRYRIAGRLGRGGMAEVFSAEDVLLGRRVAVKVMAPHIVGDAQAVARFRREARTVAALSHPHIVPLFDVGSEGDNEFLVLELVAGPSLADRLASEGRFSVEEAVTVADQIAAALGAAHERGLVHRDVKPSNVLFSADGHVKVSDFGIARAVAGATTMTAGVQGSVPYVAPEQALGELPDPRSDLYALGCVIFEMVTGRPPFVGDSAVALVGQHLHREAPAPSDLVPDLPAQLDALVGRLLAKAPPQRPADAATVRRELARVATGSTVVLDENADARSSSPARPVRPWQVATAMLVAGAAAASVLAIQDRGRDPAASPDDTPAAAPSVPAMETAAPVTPAPSPSPSPTVPPSPSPAARPEDPTTAIRRVLAQGRLDGLASGKAVDEIEDRLAEVVKKRREGKPEDARKKVDELEEKLDDLLEKGEVDARLVEELRGHLRELRTAA
jgi:serine/threonine protein kinase